MTRNTIKSLLAAIGHDVQSVPSEPLARLFPITEPPTVPAVGVERPC